MNDTSSHFARITRHVQAVLSAPIVEVFVAGRAPLNERQSMRFIADQAIEKQRVGFAIDGHSEKYEVKGGLAGDEVDELFRTAGGDRAEREVKDAATRWIAGEAPRTSVGLPPWVGQTISQNMTVTLAIELAASLRNGRVRSYVEAATIRPSSGIASEQSNRRR